MDGEICEAVDDSAKIQNGVKAVREFEDQKREIQAQMAAQKAYAGALVGGHHVASSDFQIRDAAMGHALQFEQTLKDAIEYAQIIEHYLRFGDYKEAPTATEEENT